MLDISQIFVMELQTMLMFLEAVRKKGLFFILESNFTKKNSIGLYCFQIYNILPGAPSMGGQGLVLVIRVDQFCFGASCLTNIDNTSLLMACNLRNLFSKL